MSDENWSLNYHTTHKTYQNLLKNGDSAIATYSALRGDYGLNNHTTTQAIANIAIVSKSVADNSNISIQELGLCYGTLLGILHLDLHLHPYKV